MSVPAELETKINSVVRQQLSAAAVNNVIVNPGIGSDGDAVLHVLIVLQVDERTLDDTKMLGLAGHLRSTLINADYDGFPLVSFISKNEARKLKLTLETA